MIKSSVLGREALTKRLNDLVPEAEKQAQKAKLEVSVEAARLMAGRAPVDTGEYRNSIVGGYQRDHPGTALAGVTPSKDKDATGIFAPFFWRFLEFGTRAHLIKSKGGEPLAFQVNGADEFASVVNHPATPAQPHIFPTWRAYRPKAKRKIAEAVNKAVRAAMKKS